MAAEAVLLMSNLSPAIVSILPRTLIHPPHTFRWLAASTSSISPLQSLTPSSPCRMSRRSISRIGASSSDFEGLDEDEGNTGGEEEAWQVDLRRRLREMEEMKELENRAEELQTRITGEVEEQGVGVDVEDEEERKNRVRRELEKLAIEQEERRKTAKLMYELGQKMYGKGMYGRAIEFYEGALTIIPKATLFGGEIQIWLAMAYEANNRHGDCIELYQKLEKKHPIISIRRQAAELRYILQAPKLKITKDEMVTIPLIGSSYDSYAGTWSDKGKTGDWITKTSTRPSSSSKNPWTDYIGLCPPTEWEKNDMVWLSVTFWLSVVGVVLFLKT